MSAPSEKAIDRAQRSSAHLHYNRMAARSALEAAHDPALGLAQSVCLRDVVNALIDYDEDFDGPAKYIEREFAQGDASKEQQT